MRVKSLLAEGRLDEALQFVEESVRKDPIDYRLRTQLFALCCFAGNFERALLQLTILAQEDQEAHEGVAVYRGFIAASAQRERVMRGEEPGQCLFAEPAYLREQLQVIQLAAAGQDAEAKQLASLVTAKRGKPLMQCESGSGFVGDADDRIAPFAEVFMQDRYVWVPWEQVRSLRVPPPIHLRDLLWTPVVMECGMGPLRAFMPVLYPGSAQSADPLVRLGRVTVWQDNESGLSVAKGARLLSLSPDAEGSEPGCEVELLALGMLTQVVSDPVVAGATEGVLTEPAMLLGESV